MLSLLLGPVLFCRLVEVCFSTCRVLRCLQKRNKNYFYVTSSWFWRKNPNSFRKRNVTVNKKKKKYNQGSVHTSPEKFENGALFRRNCPPRTELFENALENEGIWKRSFAFSCGRKEFWKRSFSNTMTSRKSRDFPQTQIQNGRPVLWGRRLRKHSTYAVSLRFSNTFGTIHLK